MGLRERIEQALDLGPALDPRRVHVAARRQAKVQPLVSTAGARVKVSRDGWDGELALLVLYLHRKGIPMELVEGPPGLWLDGRAATIAEVRGARLP